MCRSTFQVPKIDLYECEKIGALILANDDPFEVTLRGEYLVSRGSFEWSLLLSRAHIVSSNNRSPLFDPQFTIRSDPSNLNSCGQLDSFGVGEAIMATETKKAREWIRKQSKCDPEKPLQKFLAYLDPDDSGKVVIRPKEAVANDLDVCFQKDEPFTTVDCSDNQYHYAESEGKVSMGGVEWRIFPEGMERVPRQGNFHGKEVNLMVPNKDEMLCLVAPEHALFGCKCP